MASRTKSGNQAPRDEKSTADNNVQAGTQATYLLDRVVTEADARRNPNLDIEAGEVIAFQVLTREEAIAAGVDVDKAEADLAEKHKDLDTPITVFEKGSFVIGEDDEDASPFRLTLTVDGTAYESEGVSFEEAILSMTVPKLVSKGTLVLEKDGKRAERMVFPKHLKRPLVNRDAATFLGKQMSMLLR